jgi:hypothetical protein
MLLVFVKLVVTVLVRCSDCIYVTSHLCGVKYFATEKFAQLEIKPSEAWKCPYDTFSPSPHASLDDETTGKRLDPKKNQK